MNKKIIFLTFHLFTFSLFFACQSKTEVQPASQPTDTLVVKPAKNSSRQQAQNYSTASKGKIESVREIPVFSRLAEQIVMFGIEKTGGRL